MTINDVYLNGEFLPLEEAKISVLDRGFIFGDGVYEVVPVYQSRMFCADAHLQRLERSLQAIRIHNQFTRTEWLSLLDALLQRHDRFDGLIYLQVTRGVAKRAHAFPANATPTIFAMCTPVVFPSAEMRVQGVACVTQEDIRWKMCHIKSTSLLGNVLAAQNAVEHQAIETIQFRDGILTEASASNVWVVKDGEVYAPPLDGLILEGIRYGLMATLCEQLGIALHLGKVTETQVRHADEILLSSATKEILPVTLLDGRVVGNGKPGRVYERLYAAYQGEKQTQCGV